MFRALFVSAPRQGRSVRHRALLAGWLLASFGPASYGADALTLADALHIAQDRSLQLVAQDAGAQASRERAVAAGQRPGPVFKAALTNLPINGPDRFSLTRDFMTMRSVGVMQEFTRDDKRTARAARFEREAEAAGAARTAALAELQRETAIAWLNRHFQERMLDVLQEQRREATLQIESADAAYRAGRGAQADAFAARSAVASIDDDRQRVEREIASATTRLARWVGAAAGSGLGAPPELATPPIDADRLEVTLTRHPRLVWLSKQEEVARAEVDVAQRNKRSDWTVELMYSQRGPAYSNMVSVNLSIPLQIDQANRQDREVAAGLALVNQAQALREEAARELIAETLGWLQEWSSNRERLAHYDRELIPLAAERTRAAMAGYRGGGTALGAVLEARRTEIETRLKRLQLELKTAELWARLEFLIPRDDHAVMPDRAMAIIEKQP